MEVLICWTANDLNQADELQFLQLDYDSLTRESALAPDLIHRNPEVIRPFVARDFAQCQINQQAGFKVLASGAYLL